MLCRKFYRIPNQCYDKMCKCHVSPFHFFLITEYRHTAFLNPVTGYIYIYTLVLNPSPREVQRSKVGSCKSQSKCLRDTCHFLFLLLLSVSCLFLALWMRLSRNNFQRNHSLWRLFFFYLCDVKLVLVNKINYITLKSCDKIRSENLVFLWKRHSRL